MAVFDTTDQVFRNYLFYSAILVVKMMLMSILTGRQRMKNKSFANPEDAANLKGKVRVDENVERVRRAHLNDLENITLFYVVGFIYTLTNPSVFLATLLFRTYTISRFMHTLVYAVVVVPQPARGLAWGLAFAITGYMAVQSIVHFL